MQVTTTETTKRKGREVLKAKADRIVRHHMYAGMGISLVPVPLLDFACLTGVQFNMLRKIAKVYGSSFSKGEIKNILFSLFGGAFPVIHAGPLAASVTKFVPVAGQTAGTTSMPILAGAVTYAIGRLVTHHLARGVRFTGLDPKKVKDEYAKMFEEGKKVASNMRQSQAGI